MSEIWDAEEAPQIEVEVNGEHIPVEADQQFGRTVKQLAKAHGLRKFTVLADGEEVSGSDAPDNFEGLSEVQIQKYDEAA